MFCTNCGQQNIDNASFCIQCGKSIQMVQTVPEFSPKFDSLTAEDSTIHSQRVNSSPRKSRLGIIIALAVGSLILISAMLILFLGVIPQLNKEADNRLADTTKTAEFSIIGLWSNEDIPVVVNFKNDEDVIIYDQNGKVKGTYEYDEEDEEGVIFLDSVDIDFEISGNEIDIETMGDFNKVDDEDFSIQEFIDDNIIATTVTDMTAVTTTAAPDETTKAEETTATTTAPAAVVEDELLRIWSFTNEIKVMGLAFQKNNPNVAVEYTMIPMTNGEYQKKIQASLSTDDIPDVIAMDISFVKSYVESDLLADIGDLLPKAKVMETFQYTIDIGTYEGVTKAFSYQATPGAYFYRRSLAKEYLGTDEPDKVQEFFKDIDTMTATASLIKEKSGGSTYTISALGEWTNVFYSNRTSPWIVDGKFVIDPTVDKMMGVAETFRENGYESQAKLWYEEWFKGMNDTLVDAEGNTKKVFGYFLPTWGLPYVLQTNCSGTDASGKETSTAGDWGLIPGPMSYYWGGTWLGVMEGAANKETALKFIEFATLDEENLENWATGVYTNEYLKAINPSIDNTLCQPAGDFVSSLTVINTITDKAAATDATAFLNGQNPYPVFAASALTCSGTVAQGSDEEVTLAFNEPLNNFFTGAATKEEAIAQFKAAIASAFPNIVVE